MLGIFILVYKYDEKYREHSDYFEIEETKAYRERERGRVKRIRNGIHEIIATKIVKTENGAARLTHSNSNRN